MIETASWLRRILALFVDWFACMAVVLLFIGGERFFAQDPAVNLAVTSVYVLESTVLTATLGGSFGKLVTRLRVVRADGSGRPLSPLMALVRTLLICLVIPPLVFKPDGRGLHDLAAGSVTVPMGSGGAR